MSAASRGSRAVGRSSGVWRTERPFLAALLLGVLVRVVVQVAFPPAFVYSDGPTYLKLVDLLAPSPDRPVGYGVLLRALSWLTRSVEAVAVTQHLLGLLTAVVLYALLRRWGLPSWLATLAALPLLLDAMQLLLEHSALSDVLFDLLVVLAVAALAWRGRPRTVGTVLAGLLLGAATLVRIVGEPTVLAAVLFCLLAAATWRARLLQSLVVVVAFAVPLVAYAGWYHQTEGSWALTQASGRALYMRTTTFVDCRTFVVPPRQRRLCPTEPVGQRLDPTQYGWHDGPAKHFPTAPGVSPDQALRAFAVRAMLAQPLDYARIVGRDFLLGFTPTRTDHYEYGTADKWSFSRYLDFVPRSHRTQVAYATHGGQTLSHRQPWVDVVAGYGRVVYLPGPLTLVLVLGTLVGVARRRAPGAPETRPLALLLLALGVGLVLVPDLTAEFTWRYQLPLVVLAPPAAALAFARTRARTGPATVATPGADLPDGGVARPGADDVTGTPNRA